MALIKCNECGKEISDKASACPNCGCPIELEIKEESNIKDSQTNEKEAKNALTIAIFILIFILMIALGSVGNNADRNEKENNLEIKVQYETNPITGETKITSINNKTKEDVIDDVMNWAGFEKVEE